VEVQKPLGVGLVVGGSGVEAHGVGEGRVEDAVVAAGDLLEDGGEATALSVGEGFYPCDVLFGEKEELEGPDGPEGDKGSPGFVFGDDGVAAGPARG
jgi:hypothetical protein